MAGKRFLITGASRGIGFATAQQMANNGDVPIGLVQVALDRGHAIERSAVAAISGKGPVPFAGEGPQLGPVDVIEDHVFQGHDPPAQMIQLPHRGDIPTELLLLGGHLHQEHHAPGDEHARDDHREQGELATLVTAALAESGPWFWSEAPLEGIAQLGRCCYRRWSQIALLPGFPIPCCSTSHCYAPCP